MPNFRMRRRLIMRRRGLTTTFNPSDKDASLTLTNGNLTVTHTVNDGFNSSVRSIAFHSSGKYYYTVLINTTSGGTAPVGIANATYGLGNNLGNDLDSCGFLSNGVVRINGSTIGTGTGFNTGDTVGVAVDFDNSKIWFRQNAASWNNNGSADPATNVGGFALNGSPALNPGPYFACIEITAFSDSDVANFGATAYANAAPSGFSNW